MKTMVDFILRLMMQKSFYFVKKKFMMEQYPPAIRLAR